MNRPEQPPPPASDFFETLHRLTPHVWATPTIVAANVLLFGAMVLNGAHPLMPGGEDLLRWGANYGPFVEGGEPWRLASCMFVHVGLVHLGFNMYVLWDVGQVLERMAGNVGFLLIYFLSGLAASLSSVFLHPGVISAGASGAVFGAYGAFVGFLLRGRGSIPPDIRRHLQSAAFVFIAFNIAFGFSVPAIDNAAHIGGLIAGFVLGLMIGHPITPQGAEGRPYRNALALLAGGFAVMGALYYFVRG